MIRRLLTRILLLVLTAFCGYNWVQMRRLQAQVNDLNARLAAHSPSATAPADWMMRAELRIQRTQDDLSRSNWSAAERELRLGMEELKNARGPAVSSSAPSRRLREMRTRMEELQKQADALRHKAAIITRRHAL